MDYIMPRLMNNECPQCKNKSLVLWCIRLHEDNKLTNNPTEIEIGFRCEKCRFTTVTHPMWVFKVYSCLKKDLNAARNPNFDDLAYEMLLRAVERCIIDHRKDCIPQEVWNVVEPRLKKDMARSEAKQFHNGPISTPEYWEGNHSLFCYEAYGKCIWGFD
jgi:hypothetical protein